MTDELAIKKAATAETLFAEQILALAKTKLVTDAASLALVEELCKDVKAQWKRINDEREKISKPLWQAHKNVNAFFAPALEAFAKAEEHLKGEIARHMREERAKHVVVVQEVAKGADLVIPVPAELSKGVSVHAVPDFEIVAPHLVPRQFCSPDPDKIKRHLATGGLVAIPGVRFFEKEIVSVRT